MGIEFLTRLVWRFVADVSQILECDEREAVLGDLLESGEDAGRAVLDVAALVVYRKVRGQTLLWKSWRPWFAAFGIALPSTLCLMGISLSVIQTYRHSTHLGTLLWRVFLMIAWSWTGGFLIGFVSRRTVLVTAALSSLPCLFCLERFRVASLSRFSLLLFLPPAIWGVHQGLRRLGARK